MDDVSLAVGSADVTAGTVVPLGNGLFGVTASHTYAVAGSYPLTVVVHDVGGSSTAVSGVATVQTIADLVASALSGVPASAQFGQTLTVHYHVQNAGTGPASANWTDGIYLSTSNTFDNTAVLLNTVPVGSDSPLAVGGGYTRDLQVALPLGAASVVGAYYILVKPDHANQQLKLNNNDAIASSVVAVTLPPLPNLIVNGVAAPVNGITGQTVQLTWTDQNIGAVPAVGPWLDKVYLATDARGHNPTLLASIAYVASLANGDSVQRVQPITLPGAAGTYWFVVTTNADGAIQEGPNGSNSSSVAASSIVIVQAPLPDLVVTSITPPPSGVVSGTSVPITSS